MDQEKRVVKPQIVKLNDREAVIKVVQRNGKFIDFLIDSENIPLVGRYKWFAHMGYCCRTKNGRQQPLSWELFGKPPKGYLYHHLGENRKDYRRSNLRLVTWSVNNLLKKAQPNRTTGRRGISRYGESYVAIIGAGNKRKSFKTFGDAVEARKQFESTMLKAIHAPLSSRCTSKQTIRKKYIHVSLLQ